MQSAQGLPFDFPPGPLPTTVSKGEFARLIGVTAGRVSQLITRGLPVEPNGRIHIERGRAWLRENVDPNRRRAMIEDAAPVLAPTANPRAVRAVAEAKLISLKADRLEGSLISRAAVLRAIEARARQERDAWIGWTNRVAAEIARITGADTAAVYALLDRLVREQLQALADMPAPDIITDHKPSP